MIHKIQHKGLLNTDIIFQWSFWSTHTNILVGLGSTAEKIKVMDGPTI